MFFNFFFLFCWRVLYFFSISSCIFLIICRNSSEVRFVVVSGNFIPFTRKLRCIVLKYCSEKLWSFATSVWFELHTFLGMKIRVIHLWFAKLSYFPDNFMLSCCFQSIYQSSTFLTMISGVIDFHLLVTCLLFWGFCVRCYLLACQRCTMFLKLSYDCSNTVCLLGIWWLKSLLFLSCIF